MDWSIVTAAIAALYGVTAEVRARKAKAAAALAKAEAARTAAELKAILELAHSRERGEWGNEAGAVPITIPPPSMADDAKRLRDQATTPKPIATPPPPPPKRK